LFSSIFYFLCVYQFHHEGFKAAAAAAGIEAGLAVILAGGSIEEAEAACNAAAGIESGC